MNECENGKCESSALYLCIPEGKKLELSFLNFLAIKKIELDSTTINNDSFIESWAGERSL